MKAIIKGKWFVLLAWMVVAVGLFLVAPNMADLVKEKGDIKVPEGYSSALAGKIMDEVQEQKNVGDTATVALVFHNDKKLTKAEISEAERAIRELEAAKKKLGITEILTHFNEPNLKDQLVSDDGKTIMVSIKHTWNKKLTDKELRELFYKTTDDVKVEHYYTGSWLISESLMTSSQEGLKKTEGITVVFILGVLLLVFRSVVAPFIPLITVGFTYLTSQSIVAFLVDKVDFPISSYTQIFLVAVLFGIGTDYCILLLSRFKEELAEQESITDAIVATYKNAGRTVFFSGLAVMIGFAAIGFSQFQLYQSAAAVAVGVAILLIALFTIVPFFMAVLGLKIYWPSKKTAEHGESKLWGAAGKFSLARPFIALLIVAAVCVPFLVTYHGTLSFNSLEEVSGDIPAIKGFNAIAESFSPGEAMATQVVIKNDEKMDSLEYLNLVEALSQDLEKVNLVDKVRSATRPLGETIEDLYVSKQAKTLAEGLGQGKDGLMQISDGLHQAESELVKSSPQLKSATDGIGSLVSGTSDLKSGLVEIQTNLAKIENGMRQGSAGSTQIRAGLAQAKAGAEQLAAGHQQLLKGYQDVGTNLTALNNGYQQIGGGLAGISANLSQITNEDFSKIESDYQGITNSPEYGKIKGTVTGVQGPLAELSSNLAQLNAGLAPLTEGLNIANANYKKLVDGQAGIAGGLQALIDGIAQQQAGFDQLANGQGQIVDNFPKVTNGLTEINKGQQQLLDGFGGLGDQMTQLTDGLGQSADGLDKISDGLASAQDYVSGLSVSSAFYLPEEMLTSKDFAQVLDTYFSPDRKVMTMDVVFKESPYSNEAIDQVKAIKSTIKQATKGTKLENAVVAVGGITSTNADLETMSNQDYTRTVIYMLIGISIILIFLFRSIIMPAYLIGSLILTYYTAMSINEVIFMKIFHYTGISWAVPFFAFIILMALGIDYSIFLMDRFNEYKELTVRDAMQIAMKKMGTVIISAAIILGGTFAAMMPSGMLSLLQIASIILTGLLLYAFVILPLFVPVMVKTFGEANWWPFKRPTN
ncbi:MMPL domain-containing protein [Neobacillus bataviensis LMG 21833]|uniref:MMPL domain-containing protein n=1 Tax=Neobacillus bataviensis LMG 21833 TaxID=1117379 RepID=K6CFM1_9BACI|nr:MMPL family transporter [Neobacillus bataviensis]EKN69940.1 MMPL domain-containing protein [Neobacillus bataviensis LMG 21833]